VSRLRLPGTKNRSAEDYAVLIAALDERSSTAFERRAFASDRNWHKWVVKLIDPFTRKIEEACLEPPKIQEAMEFSWIMAK
jgi:hypothetical protein